MSEYRRYISGRFVKCRSVTRLIIVMMTVSSEAVINSKHIDKFVYFKNIIVYVYYCVTMPIHSYETHLILIGICPYHRVCMTHRSILERNSMVSS